MFTKFMIYSAFRSLQCASWLNAFPIEGFVNSRRVRILRPRWRLLIWCLFAFGLIPIKFVVVFYNLLNEFARVQDDTLSLRKPYVLKLIFLATFLTMGLALNLNTALKIDALVESMNQSLVLDKWLQRK